MTVHEPASKLYSTGTGTTMKTRLSLLALGLSLALVPLKASPEVIVSSSGSFDGWIVLYSGQAFGVSWTQTTPHNDVSITADLTGFGSTDQTGRAFLSTSIGTGATPAGEVAYTAFTFPSAADDVTLFSGLNLPAGQYYLSLVGDSPDFGSGWIWSDSPDLETGPGAALGGSYGFVSPGLTYLPSSAVYDGGIVPNFSVEATAVPDSSSWVILVAASAFLLVLSRNPVGRKMRAAGRL